MANLLDKFQKSVVGSRGKISDYGNSISPRGDFKRVTGINVILMSWTNILLTPKNTYDHDPQFGSDLYNYIFEPADKETISVIKDIIKADLMTYDDRAKISNIDVKFLRDRKGFNVNITVNYQGETGELSATIDESTYLNMQR